MAAIGTAAAQQLIAAAEAAGLTAKEIAAHVRVREDHLDVISGADRRRIELLIADTTERSQVLDRICHLAQLAGRDPQVVRANAAKWTTSRLRDLAAQQDRYLRNRGIDTRTEAEKAADAAARAARREAPATTGQVNYLVTLLARRARSGEGGGFVSTKGLDSAGNVDRAALEALTVEQASALIDSLTGNY